jgi:hypothetical protein
MGMIKNLIEAGCCVFQRNALNQLPRHCSKGNFVIVKTIKMFEQKKVREMFSQYSLLESRLLVQTAEVHYRQNKLNYSPGTKQRLLYENFTELFIGIKRGDLRPQTHVPNLPPML